MLMCVREVAGPAVLLECNEECVVQRRCFSQLPVWVRFGSAPLLPHAFGCSFQRRRRRWRRRRLQV